MHQITSREEYLNVLDNIIANYAKWVYGDPVGVVVNVVGSYEHVDGEESYVRTEGGGEVLPWAFYPLDIVAYSEQPIKKVKATEPEGNRLKFRQLDVFAVHTMAIDLEERLRGELED